MNVTTWTKSWESMWEPEGSVPGNSCCPSSTHWGCKWKQLSFIQWRANGVVNAGAPERCYTISTETSTTPAETVWRVSWHVSTSRMPGFVALCGKERVSFWVYLFDQSVLFRYHPLLVLICVCIVFLGLSGQIKREPQVDFRGINSSCALPFGSKICLSMT